MRYEDASLSGSFQAATDGSDAIGHSNAIAAAGLASESLAAATAAAAAAAEAQRIVPGVDGVVVLPAGVELSDIRVVGRDLVITLPNGEQMIIVDGAVFVPQLVINNVEVPAANLAALLIDSEPQPAAGQAQSSGGNFGVPVAPLDPGVPLGDLLPPTNLSYTPPEFRDPGFFLRDEEEDRDVEIGENAVVQLDDDALAGGNPGGTGDDPDGANTSGFLSGSGGNGPLTFDLLTTGAPTGFTYEDGPDGSVLVKQGGTVVLTITVDAATGEYSVTQNAPIMHPAGGDENNVVFTISYTVTDHDGDSQTGTLIINVDDDTPTIDVAAAADDGVVLVTDDADTIGSNSDTATSTADFSGVFSLSFSPGADGASSTPVLSYELGTAGGASGLTQGGAAINLYLIGGVVVGSTAASAAEVTAANTVFDVSVDASGTVTLTQYSQIDHTNTDPSPTGAPFSDQLIALVDSAVTLTATADYSDNDGDPASDSATIEIGANLQFSDDGPRLVDVAIGRGVVIDETTAGTPAGFPISATSAGAMISASALFGADGPAASNALSFGISINGGGTTPLATAIGDYPITLVQNGANQIIGQFDDGSGVQTAFTVTMNADGSVTVVQNVPLEHLVDGPPGPAHNDPLSLAGLINGTVTATDFDGDTATATIDLGSGIVFRDDGPKAIIDNDADSRLILTTQDADTIGEASDTASVDFSTIIKASGLPGADGGTVLPLSYALGTVGGASGLTQGGQPITLFLIDGVVVGSTASSAAEVTSANTVFDVSVTQGGVVTLTQYSQIDHPAALDPTPGGAPYSDQLVSLVDDVVTLSATVTVVDNDGDTASRTVTLGIGSNLQFADDGPRAIIDNDADSSLILTTQDADTIGDASDSASVDFSTIINSSGLPGADGGTVQPLSYALGTAGGASGLTHGGQPINLFLIDGVVVGSTASSAVDVTAANTVFDVSVTQAGVVTLTQYSQIDHPAALDPTPGGAPYSDQLASLVDDLVTLSATVTVVDNDGDVDARTVTLGIGANLQFADDGPVVTDLVVGSGVSVDETAAGTPAGFPISGTSPAPVIDTTGMFGADGPAASGSQSFAMAIIGSGSTELRTAIGDHPIRLVQINSTTIEGHYNDGTEQLAFTLTMNADGSITVVQNVPLEHLVDGPEGPAHNDPLTLDGLIEASVTVTDGDGDTASGSIEIGSVITFRDDGPRAIIDNDPDTDLVLTTQDADTIGAAADIATADFSTIIKASGLPGADGGVVQPLSYQLGTAGGSSGLTQDGAAINLFLIGGVVVGSTASSAAEVTSANTVFDVSVTQGGVVTLTQYSQIDHPAGLDPTPGGAPYSDQLASLVDDLVTLSATVTVIDNDGDTASRSVTLGIGSNIQFADDGPAITSPATANSTVILDETAGSSPLSSGAPISVTSAAAMISAAVDYGADGQGAAPVYGLSLLNGSAIGTSIASGLTTAAGDFPITLTLTSATTIAGTYDDGGIKTAFTLTMNADGTVTVMQYEALEHLQDGATAAHHNDALTLVNASLQSLVNATVTYQDGDADTVSSSVGIGSAITFLDDAGTLGSFSPLTVPNETGATGSGTFAYDPGADGHGSFAITGPALAGVTYSTVQNANGALLTATADPDGAGGNPPVTVFTLQVNVDGTYDFTLDMPEVETTTTVSLKGLSPSGPTPFVQTPDGLVEFTGSGNGVNSSTPGFGISNQFVGNGESFTIEFHSVGQAGNQASSENATFVNSAVLHNDNINGSLTIKVTFHNDVTGETEVQTIAVTGSSTVLDPATMSQFNWVEIEGVGGTGQGVRFTSLDYTTKTVSQDLDLAFQVQAMDQDGDVTSVQTLSVTVDANPSGLATLRTLEGPSSSTTNATVFAAVAAAAGLAALPAAAEPLKSDDGYAPLPLETQGVGNAVVGKVAIDAPEAESNPALFGADTASVDDEAGQPRNVSRTSQNDEIEPASLDDGAGQDAAPVNSAASDQADAPATHAPAPAAEIVMPPAEALSALVGKSESVDGESVPADDASVGKVLADALNGGDNGPDIDALLAALPDGNAVNGGGNPATEGLASHQPDAVPGWDSGHFAGLSQGPAFMMEAAVLHHDAVPAA